ncbi:MAG: DUF4294 domain-containing protein [Bacteroidales bacterium]|jgi:hypothetical protein|nr:DUF4294 domain-containing protein [Bacteroidales bacterium]
MKTYKIMQAVAGFWLLVYLLLLGTENAEAQLLKPRRIVMYGTVVDNDTIPKVMLKEVKIVAPANLLSPEEIRKNKKLIRNIKIVLPYAKLAKNKLLDLNNRMLTMSKSERKKFMKAAEMEIEKEYAAQLKNLTISQGHLLIKLVDRETGSSSYTLVQELRGSFRAFFYQTFAKLFGYDLKAEFDPVNNKKDNLIDRVVRSIEQGKI